MKKILFLVCTSDNDTTGFNLFINHPYGQVDGTSWEVMLGNDLAKMKDKNQLSTFIDDFSAIYKIKNSIEIAEVDQTKDCIYLNYLSDEIISHCDFINTSIILKTDLKIQNTSENERVITLLYQRTNDFSQDASRMRNDFYNIVYQTKPNISKKEIYELDRTLYPAQCELLDIHPQRMKFLTNDDKESLRLNKENEYLWDTIQNSNREYKYSIYRNIQQLLQVQCYT